MRPALSLFEVCVLETRPLMGPVALEKGVPTDTGLCFDGALTIAGVTSRINGCASEPGVNAFEEDDHQFKMCVSVVEMGVESTQEGLAPGGQFRAGTSKEMLLRIDFVAGREVVGRGTPFGFLSLGRKHLMVELE